MPANYDFTIFQGATFDQSVVWKDGNGQPVHLGGYTARMHVRRRQSAETPELELTTENGRIVLGGALGTVQLLLPAAETAALAFRRGVYDLELEAADGTVTRLMEGQISVSPEVTR